MAWPPADYWERPVRCVLSSDPLLSIDDSPPPPRARRLLGTVRDWSLTFLGVAVLWLGLGALRAPDLPDQAPDFTLQDLSGESVSLADLRGRTVVLNFWATWCGPCRYEIPALNAFAADHPEIPVLGIAVDGTPSELRQAAKRLEIAYPVLVIDEDTQAAYGVSTLPTTVVVGPEGEVVASHSGLIVGPHLRLLTRL